MHYVPESAHDFLPTEASLDRGSAVGERGFHYQSAPVYLLTLAVGALLGADLLIGLIADPAWAARRAPFGFRLSLLAAVLGGARILYQTLEGLFEGRFGAGLALTIAALAAIMLGEHTTAAIVVFIALCGESIEGYTLDRAQSAIRKIFNLCPERARVVRDGREREVPVGEVRVGDMVAIRPGERIPVDGVVAAGASSVDESALSGESLPVDKSAGSDVFTGTLNQFGSLTVTARRVGAETTLAKVVQLVAEATRQKTPLERTADRLARLFLPFVLGAALVTLVAWRFWGGGWIDGVKPALGVLVVACPCPLILATPTAVIAAMAWLARTGVVVKGSVALERLAAVDLVAFDKTGTLTRGELTLEEVAALPPLDESELLRTAAIAERRSEHLLARLIVREAESRNMVIPATDDFTSHPGAGVVARVRSSALGPWADALFSASRDSAEPANRTVVVGNRALLAARSIPVPEELQRELARMEQSGATTLIVALDDRPLGAIAVKDAVREESRAVIAGLKQAGVRTVALLTGDRAEPARAVAGALDLVDEVDAGLLPADKARWIESRIHEGRRVAMVGDGVNDAPALARATVGVALGGVGSDIAAEAGDIVLLGDPLRPLPGLLRLAQALVRNIRQSIFVFAFGMNAVGMLLCASGLLSPVGGAVFHEASSLAVMLNAMRLLWFERWGQTSLGRAWQGFLAAAEWLALALSPTRWVFRLLDNWPTVAGVLAPAAVLAWLLSGVVLIRDDERAVVTRFGRADADLGPGLYWRFPVPFERVYREPVGRLRTVQIGFRSSDARFPAGDELLRPPVEWTSDHNEEAGFQLRPEESLVLTGDEVLVELTAEVHWKIADLRAYLFTSARPAETLRDAAESALREMAARRALDGILTAQRRQIERECLETVRRRIAHCKLGIDAVELALLDVHPPRAVVSAYRDVADALEEEDQRVNEAEAYYGGKLLSAAGERAVRLLNDADADAHNRFDRTTAGGVSRWTMTDALWSRLNPDGPPSEMVLSGESAAVLLGARQRATDVTQAAQGESSRFNELLAAYRSHPRLTGSHLYWQAIVESLSDKAVTIVDPKAAGRKRFFLGGPEELRAGAALREAEPEPAANPRPDAPPEQPLRELPSPVKPELEEK